MRNEKQTGLLRIQSVISMLVQHRGKLHAVALLEAVYTSAGVNQLLLASVERMALGADINAQVLLDGTGLKGLAANAVNQSLAVVRMDLLFHGFHLFLLSDAIHAPVRLSAYDVKPASNFAAGIL